MFSGFLLLLVASIIVVFVTFLVCLSGNVSTKIKASFLIVAFGLICWQSMVFITGHITTNLELWNNLVFCGPTAALLGSYLFVSSIDQTDLSVGKNKKRRYLSFIVLFALFLQIIALASGRIFVDVSFDSATNVYVYER